MLLASAGPTSVLAMKYRYLPFSSKGGDAASLMPSVIWWLFFSSSE